jgi:hypothetical protein
MNNQLFDEQAFLSQTTTTALAARPPIPAGSELIGVLGTPKARRTQGTKEWNRGQVYTVVDFPVSIELTPELKALTHLGTMTLTHSVFVDTTPDGRIDNSPGASAQLRYLRDAAGMNVEGREFNINMLAGRPVRVLIGHRPIVRDGTATDEVTEFIHRVGKP